MNVFLWPVWSVVTFQLYILPFSTYSARATVVFFLCFKYTNPISIAAGLLHSLFLLHSMLFSKFTDGWRGLIIRCLHSRIISSTRSSLTTVPKTVAPLSVSLTLLCFLHSSHPALKYFVSLFRLCLCLYSVSSIRVEALSGLPRAMPGNRHLLNCCMNG